MSATESGNIKDLLRERVERDMYMKFYQKGEDYMVDENLIICLYEIYTKNKSEIYFMNHEDKKEIAKAYPGFFNYKQINYGYEISKK